MASSRVCVQALWLDFQGVALQRDHSCSLAQGKKVQHLMRTSPHVRRMCNTPKWHDLLRLRHRDRAG